MTPSEPARAAARGALAAGASYLLWGLLPLYWRQRTAVRLLLFAYGARRIQLTTLGLVQYLSPTVAFFLGVLVYHEAFGQERFASFALIWLGLALYTADNLRTLARNR